MSPRGFCLAALGAVFLALPAGAGEPSRAPVHRVQAHSPAECYCRAQGRTFGMGEQACLRSPEGPRLALCVMEQNVTSWRFTQERCPES